MGRLDAPLMPLSPTWPSLQVCTWACEKQACGRQVSHLSPFPDSVFPCVPEWRVGVGARARLR